jgi:hypothetical protein
VIGRHSQLKEVIRGEKFSKFAWALLDVNIKPK